MLATLVALSDSGADVTAAGYRPTEAPPEDPDAASEPRNPFVYDAGHDQASEQPGVGRGDEGRPGLGDDTPSRARRGLDARRSPGCRRRRHDADLRAARRRRAARGTSVHRRRVAAA